MSAPIPPDTDLPGPQEKGGRRRRETRLLALSIAATLLGLLAVYLLVRSRAPEVPVILPERPGASSALSPEQPPAASAPAGLSSGEKGSLDLLGLDIPTGFDLPKLVNLDLAQVFAEGVAYRGWHCQRPQVMPFTDARQAVPAVQEGLLKLGYKLSETPSALGEDQSWVARHSERPTLFISVSIGEDNRGNVSACQIDP